MMNYNITALALGVYYGIVPAFLDRRGQIMSLLFDFVDDPAAQVGLGLSGTGASMMPEDVVVTSSARKLQIIASPVKLVLTVSDMPFDEFDSLVKAAQGKLSVLYENVALGYVGAVLKTSLVLSGAGISNGGISLIAPDVNLRLDRVSEFRATSIDESFRRHVLTKSLPGGSLEVTLDMQKIKDARWADLASMPTATKVALETIVASVGTE